MQNINFSIQGDFWDVQLYMGRLYLWTMEGTIQVFDWDKIINILTEKNNNINKQFYVCAFTNNRELEKYFPNKFQSQYLNEVYLSSNEIKPCLISEIQNSYAELPIYTDIYSKKIYAALQKGLYRIEIDPNENTIINERADKLWDNPLINFRFSNDGRIALSAAENGLFEFNLNNRNIDYMIKKKVEENIYELSNKHSYFANYLTSSLLNNSNLDESNLIYFEELGVGESFWNQDYEVWLRESSRQSWANRKLIYKSSLMDEEMFMQKGGIGWANFNKIVKTHNNDVWIYEFNQLSGRSVKEYIKEIKKISLYEWKGKVINGSINPYGVIIEAENALVIVFDSENDNYTTLTIKGPITKWHDMPRSLNYFYLLNVIFEDRVTFYSFPYASLKKNKSKNVFSL